MTAISQGAATPPARRVAPRPWPASHVTSVLGGTLLALLLLLGARHSVAAAPDDDDTAGAVAYPLAAATPTAIAAPAAAVQPLAAYRAIGARHLYDTFAGRVFKGRLPPLLYAIAIVETEIDEEGRVVNATIAREPAAAKEVMPWILGLIRQASPFPKPGTPGHTTYRDIWLVDEHYTFQLDTLTEGQD